MVQKFVMELTEASEPLTGLVTKFGGQPTWLEEPSWPLSRETGEPMQFIGQFVLAPELGLKTQAEMAYLFMSHDDVGGHVTWDPDAGENAVILQPGDTDLPTDEIENGPSICRMVENASGAGRVEEPCEFDVRLAVESDVAFISEKERWSLPNDAKEVARGSLDESKMCGTPVFVQGDELPFDDGWQLLLQIDSGSVPFDLNFGDAGVGYAFLNADGTEAKFLWQCS